MEKSIRVLRRMSYITEEQKNKINGRVLQRMREIAHLRSFMQDREEVYARNFVSDTIEAFYEAVSISSKVFS